MWPFYLERTVTVHRRVRGSLSSICEIVESAEQFSRLQPLVTKVEQDSSDPKRYRITEHLHAPARMWEYDNSFHAVFTPKEDEDGRGMDVVVELTPSFLLPKFQTRIRAKESSESGVVEVTEVLEVRMLCLLIPHVIGTMTRAHEGLMDRLRAKIEEVGN